MQIKQLEYLIAISHKKSFNAASENLFITPQSLSRSIASMENELGFKLFERNSQGVRFTRAGEKFLEAAKDITDRYYSALKEIEVYSHDVEEVSSGRLTVYAHPVFTMSMLPKAIAAFCREYPKINVCLLEEISSSILNNLLKAEDENDGYNNFKIGVLTIPQEAANFQKIYKHQKGWSFVPLMTGEYVCCVSKNSALASKRNISLKTVSKYPLIRFTNNSGNVSDVQSYFLAPYGDLSIAFSTTSIGLWISSIASNVGIGLIHNIVLSQSSMIRNEFEKVAVIPIREKTTLEVGMMVPDNSAPYVKVFVDFIRSYFNSVDK